MGVGAFFTIRTGVPWLLLQQSGPIAQGLSQSVSAALAFATRCLGVPASSVGRHRQRTLLNTHTTLESRPPMAGTTSGC